MKKLLESFLSSFNYDLPKDPEKMLYDFYFMVGYLYKDASKEAIDPYFIQKSNNEIVQREYAEKKNIQLSVEACVNKLREHMIKAVTFSLSCEFRHVFDGHVSNIEEGIVKIPPKYAQFFNDYIFLFRGISSDYSKNSSYIDRPSTYIKRSSFRKELGNEDIRKKSFAAVRKAMKDLNFSFADFAQTMEYAYNPDLFDWSGAFGGRAWMKIATALYRLIKAETTGDRIVWIDHVYDLQHNTGSVFNKLQTYYKNSGGYEWLGQALDWKRDAKNVYDYYDKVSYTLKPIVAWYLKTNTGATIEDITDINSPYYQNIVNQNKVNPEKKINLSSPFLVEIHNYYEYLSIKKLLLSNRFRISTLPKYTRLLQKVNTKDFEGKMFIGSPSLNTLRSKKVYPMEIPVANIPIYTIKNVPKKYIITKKYMDAHPFEGEFHIIMNNKTEKDYVYNFFLDKNFDISNHEGSYPIAYYRKYDTPPNKIGKDVSLIYKEILDLPKIELRTLGYDSNVDIGTTIKQNPNDIVIKANPNLVIPKDIQGTYYLIEKGDYDSYLKFVDIVDKFGAQWIAYNNNSPFNKSFFNKQEISLKNWYFNVSYDANKNYYEIDWEDGLSSNIKQEPMSNLIQELNNIYAEYESNKKEEVPEEKESFNDTVSKFDEVLSTPYKLVYIDTKNNTSDFLQKLFSYDYISWADGSKNTSFTKNASYFTLREYKNTKPRKFTLKYISPTARKKTEYIVSSDKVLELLATYDVGVQEEIKAKKKAEGLIGAMYPLTFSYDGKEDKKVVISFKYAKEIKEFYNFVSTKFGAEWFIGLKKQHSSSGIPLIIASNGISKSVLGLVYDRNKQLFINWGQKVNITPDTTVLPWSTFKEKALKIIDRFEQKYSNGNQQPTV